MQRFFIITVDTEGDNLWNYIPGSEVGTENAKYLVPFQNICESYQFKPVYLANYEMLKSTDFVSFAEYNLKRDSCEIGLHLHAWNNPPFFELSKEFDGNPYLFEYPKEIMRAKFAKLYHLYCDIFKKPPVSHRAGRWAMNEDYFSILEEFGVKVDCSFTPGKNWHTDCGQTIPCGPDYSNEKLRVSRNGKVLEVPMTLKTFRFLPSGSWRHKAKVILNKGEVWVRTSVSSVHDIKKLINHLEKRTSLDYIEFMIHSSELMPNGSPYFKTDEDIRRHMAAIDEVFSFVKRKGYIGVTLEEYAEIANCPK